MKIILGFKVRSFILAVAFSAGLGFGPSASAQIDIRSYLIDINSKTVTDIGTLGGSDTIAYGINDAGQVAGWSRTAGDLPHAFITGPNGTGIRDIGTLGGPYSGVYNNGINNAGQVTGESDTAGGGRRAFITGPNGMDMRDLGAGEGGFTNGINAAGQVVGFFIGRQAFITGPNGTGMRDLGTLGGDTSRALGINDAGQVAGYSSTAANVIHAFITDPNGMGMKGSWHFGRRYKPCG